MSDQLQHTGELIAAYLATYWGCPCHLTHIEQIPGGASRQTYLVKLDRDGRNYGVVVRRDPPSSLIDTERSHEYNTYAAVYRDGVMPVPEPIVLEQDDPGEMDQPFSIMGLIADGQAAPAGLDEPNMQPWLAQLGQKKWTMLGELARKTPAELGVEAFMSTPSHPAAHELAYWKGVIDADALHPQPIAAATIRWLESNLPDPTSQLTLVHGDYRTGNFLYTDTGEITAVLDWEMAHIGDPLEDLAWSLEPLWSPQLNLAGRLLPRQQAIDIWQRASGIEVDREDFRWWQIFASLKGLAIWISSAEDYANGTTKEPILAFAGWPMIDRQNRILLDRLAPESNFEYAETLA
jgi:aminoglycoside phosphotransferase (APT) family kinase protein